MRNPSPGGLISAVAHGMIEGDPWTKLKREGKRLWMKKSPSLLFAS